MIVTVPRGIDDGESMGMLEASEDFARGFAVIAIHEPGQK